MSSWADAVEEETEHVEAKPAKPAPYLQRHAPSHAEPRLDTLYSIRKIDFLFDRRVDHLIFVDLDGLKKGAGKHTYKFITDGGLPNSMAVLLFRRAPAPVDQDIEHLSKAQKRRNKSAGTAAGKLRVVCGSCKNALSIKPHLGSTRFLIESPHDQPAATRFLMSFYISHVVTRFKQLSRSTTKIFVISPDQGAAETIELAQKLYPECSIAQIAAEDLTSFAAIPTWGSSVVVVPARETFKDQLPGESGLDTARRRVLKYITESKSLPTTKGALESALAPFCRLRGDVDSYAIVEMLKERKVWAQCDDVCGTFYYPKKKDVVKEGSKPKKAAPALHKHADKIDPHLASGAKVVTAALALLPPEDEWEQIQNVRQKHDKAYERWPPHINLMFPFVPESKFEEIAPKMEAALKDFGPIRITMNSFSHFSHSKTSKTLFLDVDEETKAVLKRLYARLELAFPFCVNAAHGEFTPHLTLGQFTSDKAVADMIEKLQKDWQSIQFTLAHVSCLAREANTRFETKKVYSLSGKPGQVPSLIIDENSPARSLADVDAEEQVYRRVISELEAINPTHRPQSVSELNAFVRKLVPGTEVSLADLMNLLTERDVVTIKRDLAIEERLTPVVFNKALLKRLERPASEKLVSGPAEAAAESSQKPLGEAAGGEAFIKAAVYGGQRPGYLFKMGDLGLGYYKDTAK